MFIKSYGLFWERVEVTWAPGAGNRDAFRLLGRHKKQNPALRVADFRDQRGIYVLYDHYGPYYVGLATKRPIGNRLRDHTRDTHADSWDRFSWFGFRRVLKGRDPEGLSRLGEVPAKLVSDSDKTIGDVEALLIQTLGTMHRGNWHEEKFASADRWEQVRLDEVAMYVDRLR